MSDEQGFLAKTAIEFLNRKPPPTAEERSVFYANMRRTEADAYEAAVIERYARLAQEPSLWDYEMQRDFNRDLHRSGRRDG